MAEWYAARRHLVQPAFNPGAIQQIHRRGMIVIICWIVGVAVVWFNPVVGFFLYVIFAFVHLVLQLRVKSLQHLLSRDPTRDPASAAFNESDSLSERVVEVEEEGLGLDLDPAQQHEDVRRRLREDRGEPGCCEA